MKHWEEYCLRVNIALMKFIKSSLGRKRFISTEACQGRNLKVRADSETMEECLNGLLLTPFSLFLYSTYDPQPRDVTTQNRLPPYQPLIKIVPLVRGAGSISDMDSVAPLFDHFPLVGPG